MVDAVLPDIHLVGRPVLAKDTVRYVGEPVAVIVATDPYLAADAAAAVDIDVAPIDGVGDVLTALQPGSPSLHPPHDGNLAGTLVREFGDVDAAFASGDSRDSASSTPGPSFRRLPRAEGVLRRLG